MFSNERNITFRKIPDSELHASGSVWVVVGPKWREHLLSRLTIALNEKADIAWIGTGTLSNKIPPSGILSNTRRDLVELVERWRGEVSGGIHRKRMLVVEDPQAAGIWGEMIRIHEWQDLLDSASDWNVSVLIGTNIALPRAGQLIHSADWFIIRSGGGKPAIEYLTSGSGVGEWLDSIGREVFEDIRIYRKILQAIGQKNRDTAIYLSSTSDILTERVFWWDPHTESNSLSFVPDDYSAAVATPSPRRLPKPKPRSPSGSAVGGADATRVLRKLGAIIELLTEFKEDLTKVLMPQSSLPEDGSSSDDE